MIWNQVYNPFSNTVLSTIAAAIPVVTLLVLIASGKVKAHIAAIVAVILTNLIAIFIFTMPAGMSIRASLLGVVAGFFPIGWIVLNVIYLYQLTVATGVPNPDAPSKNAPNENAISKSCRRRSSVTPPTARFNRSNWPVATVSW